MSEAESCLAAFFAKDEPPARDPAFQRRVMRGVERAELIDAGLEAAMPVAAGGMAAWAALPALAPVLSEMALLAPIVGAGAAAVGSLALTYWIVRRQPALA